MKICATPTISYSNKELVFNSETEGAEYHYTITDSDIKTDAYSQDGNVELTAAYNITVWASADGYTNSNKATATLYFVDARLESETGMEEVSAKRALLVSSRAGYIIIGGLEHDEKVQLYSTGGMFLDAATASGSEAQLKVQTDDVVIVKVGNESIKVKVSK